MTKKDEVWVNSRIGSNLRQRDKGSMNSIETEKNGSWTNGRIELWQKRWSLSER